MTMECFRIDPLRDMRWPQLVEDHPRSTIFHTAGWLQALQKTYRYEPVALTTCSPGERLTNGIVFCRVQSWITGRRLVSLPFSDHCDPLVNDAEELQVLLQGIEKEVARDGCKYAELRPTCGHPIPEPFRQTESFALHRLDLTPRVDALWQGLHKDCIQRKIRRAERSHLSYEKGRSESLLRSFYRLQQITRERHALPPQPRIWFRNLCDLLSDHLTIHMASAKGQAIAAILTLRHKDGLTYKYGCSDAAFHPLGAIPWLFWKAIQEAREEGLRSLDLGRSDPDNPGLIRFKERLGARPLPLKYYRYPSEPASGKKRNMKKIAGTVLRMTPGRFLSALGSRFYRHIG